MLGFECSWCTIFYRNLEGELLLIKLQVTESWLNFRKKSEFMGAKRAKTERERERRENERVFRMCPALLDLQGILGGT